MILTNAGILPERAIPAEAREEMFNARTAFAILSAVTVMSASGCAVIEAASLVHAAVAPEGWRHANLRDRTESKTAIQKHLGQLSCMQLSDWEQVVLANLTARTDASLLQLSPPVLRDDLLRIREAMVARDCPSRERMLAEGTPRPTHGAALQFACVCWQPYGVTPIVKRDAGAAGADCYTVRAEVSPGTFAFIESVPTWGDRRHEIDRSDRLPMLGSLKLDDTRALILGTPEHRIATDAESDGWIQTSMGRFRFLTDACTSLPSDQASVAERTVIRWFSEP